MAIVVPKVRTDGEQFDETVIQTPENFVHFNCAPPASAASFFHSIKEIAALHKEQWTEHLEVLQDACENVWLRAGKDDSGISLVRAAAQTAFPRYVVQGDCDLVWCVRSDLLHKVLPLIGCDLLERILPWTRCWRIDR